jgi:hypothetical protein
VGSSIHPKGLQIVLGLRAPGFRANVRQGKLAAEMAVGNAVALFASKLGVGAGFSGKSTGK